MSPKSINVGLDFKETTTYLRSWIGNNSESFYEHTIQSGIQYKFNTTHGERIINVYYSKTKPGSRIVFNDPIFEKSNIITRDLNGQSGTQGSSLRNKETKSDVRRKSLTKYKNLARVGSDESGKGDYFGPIIICAVLLDETSRATVEELLSTHVFGIRDSKQFADSQNRNLAEALKNNVSDFEIFSYSPLDYNKLHNAKTSNLNMLIGLGHSTAIEQLLSRQSNKSNPLHLEDLPVIVDQFDTKTMPKLHSLAEKYPLFNQTQFIQTPKADANDLAVAAASIIARGMWLEELDKLSQEIGFNISKGAGPKVDEDAKKILNEKGLEWLNNNVKMDFKNTTRVLL